MAEIDPELRDKIVETHTLVKRMDEEQKEHKRIMNARFREAKKEFIDHKRDTKENFKDHDTRIDKNKDFRIRVMAVIAFISTAFGLLGSYLSGLFSGVRG